MGGGIPSMVKRGIHKYTKRTTAAFNHGCDSTAENLEEVSRNYLSFSKNPLTEQLLGKLKRSQQDLMDTAQIINQDKVASYAATQLKSVYINTIQTVMCCAGFFPDAGMMILLASVIVMDVCMLMGQTSGWSNTKEYCLLSQFQLTLARNIITYVLCKCKHLVGVVVFGHKAAGNILPW